MKIFNKIYVKLEKNQNVKYVENFLIFYVLNVMMVFIYILIIF